MRGFVARCSSSRLVSILSVCVLQLCLHFSRPKCLQQQVHLSHEPPLPDPTVVSSGLGFHQPVSLCSEWTQRRGIDKDKQTGSRSHNLIGQKMGFLIYFWLHFSIIQDVKKHPLVLTKELQSLSWENTAWVVLTWQAQTIIKVKQKML